MTESDLAHLSKAFELGSPVSVEEDTHGALNTNYVLTTTVGTFFIKSVRTKQIEEIPFIAQVETFFSEHGIPAICMKTDAIGQVALRIEDRCYTVYPYIDNNSVYTYTPSNVQAMGEMLAQIHLAGSMDVPEYLNSRTFKTPPTATVIQELEQYRARILELSQRDSIDEVFLSYINLKLEKLEMSSSVNQLPNDTLVHGDYHERNLLFGSEGIVGVCDWEKALLAPRAYELARAIEVICFGTSSIPLHTQEEQQAIALSLLEAYRSVYPIDSKELTAGLLMRREKILRSFWIERQHYDLSDTRSDKFIQQEMSLIQSGGLVGRIE